MFKEKLIGLLPAILCIAAWMPAGVAQLSLESVAGRDAFIHAPSGAVRGAGTPMPLVVVLHGGLGNAELIVHQRAQEAGLNLDAISDERGFVVAYLDGTHAGSMLPATMLTWNAGGGCCGRSAVLAVDDVDYIERAVAEISTLYAIDPKRIFVIGHSNGAMMAQRMMCESDLFEAAVAVSGPLNLSTPHCLAGHDKSILAIHGDADRNVPIAGGEGPAGLSHVAFRSEAESAAEWQRDGVSYRLEVLPGTGHNLREIDTAIQTREGHSLAQKIADFFGL